MCSLFTVTPFFPFDLQSNGWILLSILCIFLLSFLSITLKTFLLWLVWNCLVFCDLCTYYFFCISPSSKDSSLFTLIVFNFLINLILFLRFLKVPIYCCLLFEGTLQSYLFFPFLHYFFIVSVYLSQLMPLFEWYIDPLFHSMPSCIKGILLSIVFGYCESVQTLL